MRENHTALTSWLSIQSFQLRLVCFFLSLSRMISICILREWNIVVWRLRTSLPLCVSFFSFPLWICLFKTMTFFSFSECLYVCMCICLIIKRRQRQTCIMAAAIHLVCIFIERMICKLSTGGFLFDVELTVLTIDFSSVNRHVMNFSVVKKKFHGKTVSY